MFGDGFVGDGVNPVIGGMKATIGWSGVRVCGVKVGLDLGRGKRLDGLECVLPVGGEATDPVVKLFLGPLLGFCSSFEEGPELDEEAVVVEEGSVVWVPSWVRRASHMGGPGRAYRVHGSLDGVDGGVVGLFSVAVEAVSIGGVQVVQLGRELSAERCIGEVEVGRSLRGLVLFWRRYLGCKCG